jgi:putative acetyltransferase
MPETTVGPADFADPDVLALLALHLAGMREHSPPDSVHALPADALSAPGVEVFVLRSDGRVAATGALRRIDGDSFEIKSMRTHPDHLGRGLGRTMLEHLIARAVEQGARRVSLETGSGPAFEPALALYRSRGFSSGPAFGGYVASDFNQFLHLDLPHPETRSWP